MGLHVLGLKPSQQCDQQEDQLGVGQRRSHAEDLGVDLVELPVAALLGSLAPEHRADHVEPLDRVGRIELVLDVGAHDGGRGLGPQGDHVSAAVGKGVHLLLDDVGVFADAALEEFGLLHDRDADLPKPEAFEKRPRVLLDLLPEFDLAGQDVLEAANQLNHVVGVSLGSWPRYEVIDPDDVCAAIYRVNVFF